MDRMSRRGCGTAIVLFQIMMFSQGFNLQMNMSESSAELPISRYDDHLTDPLIFTRITGIGTATDAGVSTSIATVTKIKISDESVRKIVDGQLHLCPYTSLCDHKPLNTTQGAHPCCSDCDCNPDCHIFESCCPDRLTSLVTKSQFKCITPQWKKPGLSLINVESFMMVSVCLSDYKDNFNKLQCERTIEIGALSDIPTSAPVESRRKKLLFKNKFCAYCNNVSDSDLMAWQPWLKCKSQQNPPPFSSKSLLSSVNETMECNIVYGMNPTFTASFDSCYSDAVTKCNETGLWGKYDYVVDKACNSYTSWYQKKYRNVYCYICNTNRLPDEMECEEEGQTSQAGMMKPPSFATLLNFNRANFNKIQTNCDSGYLWDPYQTECREIHCSPPKVFLNGNCSTLYTVSKGLAIDFYLRIEPNEKTLEVTNLNTSVIETVLSEWLTEVIGTRLFTVCNFDIYTTRRHTSARPEASVVVYMKIPINSNIDHLIDTIVDYNYVNITSLLDLENWTTFLDGGQYDAVDLVSMVTNQSNYRQGRTNGARFPEENCLNTIRVTTLSKCQQFHLQAHQISSRNDKFVCLRKPKLCFPKGRFIEVGDGQSIGICVQDYLDAQYLKTSITSITEGWVSLICTCLSVVCLSFTVLTYCLFRELRTLPGKNNMALATSMIIAQMFFQFGLNATDNQLFCKIIGVCIHFFWLLTMFCMHSCSLHMFRTFVNLSGKTHTMTSRTRDFVLYSVSSIVLSTTFVLINIIYSIVESDSHTIGYGDDLCYISSKTMVGVTFALPIAVVFISNKIMFTLVVYRIHNIPNVSKSSTKERSNFVIYIKLSTLTGGSWIFGFVYHWTGISAFVYLFIVATCCQGVFIMLSFVCNQRVKRFYLERCTKSHVYQEKSVDSHSRSSVLKSTSFYDKCTD